MKQNAAVNSEKYMFGIGFCTHISLLLRRKIRRHVLVEKQPYRTAHGKHEQGEGEDVPATAIGATERPLQGARSGYEETLEWSQCNQVLGPTAFRQMCSLVNLRATFVFRQQSTGCYLSRSTELKHHSIEG